jgi:hypothetical protein
MHIISWDMVILTMEVSFVFFGIFMFRLPCIFHTFGLALIDVLVYRYEGRTKGVKPYSRPQGEYKISICKVL